MVDNSEVTDIIGVVDSIGVIDVIGVVDNNGVIEGLIRYGPDLFIW